MRRRPSRCRVSTVACGRRSAAAGQSRQPLPRAAFGNDGGGAVRHAIAGGGPGRAGRIGDGGPRGEARAGQSRDHVVEQGLFAAEQMGAAGGIDP